MQKKKNISYKKCNVKPGNVPDKEAQEVMKEKIKEIDKNCESNGDVVLFTDAVHQLHNTINGYAVQLKGKENTKVLPSNTGRKRFTVVGAINPKNYKTSYVTTDGMCNKEVIKMLLDVIALDYKKEILEKKKIYLILDNARYQKAKEVQEYAVFLGIELCFLPPYCPHLNLIERLRKRLKKKLRNLYISLFSEFCTLITNIISSTQQHIEELKTLLTLNFEII